MGAGDVVEQPEHPGVQCHEAHPGVPHRFIDGGLEPKPQPERDWMPPGLPGRPGVELTAQVGQLAPDWSRFDEWATRALEFLGKDQGDGTLMDDQWQRIQEKARLCVDLASAASPHSVGQMPRIEMGEML